ncbi:MAG: GGDEF domain-containing protein [Saccharofermentans sp.]|nr:GGDEF domain-containing protein [Saccharofermentans sp.]
MQSQVIQQSAVRQLESEIRSNIAKLLVAMTICCALIEIGMGLYFWVSQTMHQTPSEYIVFRILQPTVLNALLCLLVFAANHSKEHQDRFRNRVAAISLIVFAAQISWVHSYFIPMWCLSLFALMYVSVFHDPFFQRIEAGICLGSIGLSCWQHIADYPEQLSFSLQCLAVAEFVGVLIIYMSFQLESFSRKEFLLNAESDAGKRRYQSEYEKDKLTGVYSRAYLIEQSSYIFDNCNEFSPAGIAMLDIDDFKKVNDTYGHDNGDVVLQKFGEILNSYNDGNTFCGRYGGEEFVIVFKYGEPKMNCDTIEELRADFEKASFPFMDEHVTLSAGYYNAEAQTDFDTALKMADDALYISKRSGKNRLTVHNKAEAM